MLIKTYRLRLYVLYIVPLVLMVGLVARLYWLQVVKHDFYERFATKQHYKSHTITPTRGKIFDANGHELAGSVILDTVYLEVMTLPKPGERSETLEQDLASDLANVLKNLPDGPKLTFDDIMKKIKLGGHQFLVRGVDEQHRLLLAEVVEKYRKEGVPHTFLSFEPENKRRYSRGSLAPHIVGYTWRDETGDNLGADGVEKIYNSELRGKSEKYITQKSATGKPMEPADPQLLESTFGHSVKLTINESLQAVTQNVLAQGVEKSQADSGVAICYHVKTGEVLALANYPSYSLNNVGGAHAMHRRNRALTDPIEPGSVMKIITFASLFDAKEIEPFDMIDCEEGTWVMPGSGRVIKDSHSDGVVPVSEVFQYSSNIGTIKAARAFDQKTFYRYLSENFGFGKKTGIDLPSESGGVLRHYKEWSGLSMSSLPMGYEIQVTAIQVAAAVGAIANKGAYMKPHVVKEILDHHGNTVKKIEPEYVREVADPVACRKIVELMELVVEKGTAKAAKLEGYRVGGKTGTSKKVMKNGTYGNAYIASFCGIAPIEDPEVCIYVYVDYPKSGQIYGGQIAAPVFREIAREAMRVLRVPERRDAVPPQDIQLALDKVRKQIEGRAPMELLSEVQPDADEEVSPGVVPNLRGLSLAEATKKAAQSGLEVLPRGSGVVVDQEPAAYEVIEGTKSVKLMLTNTHQSIKRLVDEYRDELSLDDPEVHAMAEATPVTGLLESTTVSLSLQVGGERVAVPVESAPEAPWSAVIGNRSQEVSPVATPYPDLDDYANTPVDPKVSSKSWAAFVKEMEAVDKANAKAAEDEAAQSGDNAPEGSSPKAAALPVPEIDGTDDLDPTRQAINPIEISTPKRTPRPKKTAEEELYNM